MNIDPTDLEALQCTPEAGKGRFNVVPRSALGFREICLGDAWLKTKHSMFQAKIKHDRLRTHS